MHDVAISSPSPGRLQIHSRSLFGDVHQPLTAAFVACVLEVDPRAQVAVFLEANAEKPHVAEIRHSTASGASFLRALSERLRDLHSPAPKRTAPQRTRKSRTPVSVGAAAVPAGKAARSNGSHSTNGDSHYGAHRSNGNGHSENGHAVRNGARRIPTAQRLNASQIITNYPVSTLETPPATPPVRLAPSEFPPALQKVDWKILKEVPGRMKLKHPHLHRRKCVCQAIERELMSVLGIDSYKTHPTYGTVTLKYNPRTLRRDQVLTILERAMAKAEIPESLDPLDLDFPLAVTSVPLAGLAQFAYPAMLPAAGLLFLYTSITTFKNAYHVVVHEKRLGVDVLDAIVVTGCVATGQIFAGSVLCLCLSFGRMLVAKTQDDSQRLLIQAFGKQSQFVKLWKDGQEVEISMEDLKQGDVIVVHTGESVPVDGLVKEGMAMVDQHALTGESTPAEKATGDRVFAGTLTVAGKVFVEVEKAGTDTASAKIAQILNDSAGYKLSSQHKGERMADRAVVPTLCISGVGLAALGPQGAVAVLNSDFGTGIRMAAPLAMLTSLALCAEKGILVKDGRALELMHDIDTVLFDKTGTLTRERPEVGRVITFGEFSRERLLQLVGSAEQRFSHPIAKAILLEFETTGLPMLPIDDSKYQVGYGIDAAIDGHKVMVGSLRYLKMEGIDIPEDIQDVVQLAHAEGHTLVMTAIDQKFAGVIELRASQRPEVVEIIHGLRKRGIKHIAIISGDHEGPTRKLAESLEMDEYFAGVLPGDKADYVERLQKQGRKVCFVGDGINDSIALKKANVSISLRGASSIATDTAQIVFMEESLHRLCELRDIASGLDSNVRRSWYMILAPNAFCIFGAFTMGFGIMASVLTNNVAALGALANGMLPLYRLANERARKEAQQEMTLAVAKSLSGGDDPVPDHAGPQLAFAAP
ncbi:MAG: heavy metal translocating P-type ATPase [Planctomycetaceae bacterium]